MTTYPIRDGMSVTRYAGPGQLPGVGRVRFQIDADTGHVGGITVREAIGIAHALLEMCAATLTNEAARHSDAGA